MRLLRLLSGHSCVRYVWATVLLKKQEIYDRGVHCILRYIFTYNIIVIFIFNRWNVKTKGNIHVTHSHLGIIEEEKNEVSEGTKQAIATPFIV